MGNERKTPEIRFDRFVELWEQRKLGEISDIRTGPFGSTLHAEDYVENGTPIITTEHFKTGDLPELKHDIPQVSDNDLRRLQNYLLRTDDIVFSRVGSVDVNALVTSYQNGWLFSGRVLRVRTGSCINSQYLHYELSTERAKNNVIVRAVGQTMPSINTEILKQTDVFVPRKNEEQAAIGNFFRSLDDIIALKKQQYEQTVNIKKAMLEKMFPKKGADVPEIRFEGFTGAWENRKLGEEVGIIMGQSPDSNYYTNNPFDHILVQGNADIKDGVVVPRVWTKQVTKTAKKGDLIISVRAPVGDVGKTDFDIVIGRGVAAVRGNEFIFQTLRRMKQIGFWEELSTGSTFDSINSTSLQGAELLIPSLPEQTAIGNFFHNLDTLVKAQREELEKLHSIKKACLFKMFV